MDHQMVFHFIGEVKSKDKENLSENRRAVGHLKCRVHAPPAPTCQDEADSLTERISFHASVSHARLAQGKCCIILQEPGSREGSPVQSQPGYAADLRCLCGGLLATYPEVLHVFRVASAGRK